MAKMVDITSRYLKNATPEFVCLYADKQSALLPQSQMPCAGGAFLPAHSCDFESKSGGEVHLVNFCIKNGHLTREIRNALCHIFEWDPSCNCTSEHLGKFLCLHFKVIGNNSQ